MHLQQSKKVVPDCIHAADPGADMGNVFSRKVIHRSWSFTEELL